MADPLLQMGKKKAGFTREPFVGRNESPTASMAFCLLVLQHVVDAACTCYALVDDWQGFIGPAAPKLAQMQRSAAAGLIAGRGSP